jgi:hypothetical protein
MTGYQEVPGRKRRVVTRSSPSHPKINIVHHLDLQVRRPKPALGPSQVAGYFGCVGQFVQPQVTTTQIKEAYSGA